MTWSHTLRYFVWALYMDMNMYKKNVSLIWQDHGQRARGGDVHRGPLISQPVPLPAAAAMEPNIAQDSKDTQKLVELQSKMRKTKREEEKAQIAAKEAAKEAKADAKAAKARENQKKREEKAALKAMKKNDDETKKKQKTETGASNSKEPAGRKSQKRKVETKEDSPKVGRARLTETPCKIRDPHRNATPAKFKQRRKREQKAKQALAKLRRQKELLPDLKDLTEPDDESKMTLERSSKYVLPGRCWDCWLYSAVVFDLYGDFVQLYVPIWVCCLFSNQHQNHVCSSKFHCLLRSYSVQPSSADHRSILVVLSAEQFCVSHTEGDSERRPDSSGRCSLSWSKYPDLGKACLGGFVEIWQLITKQSNYVKLCQIAFVLTRYFVKLGGLDPDLRWQHAKKLAGWECETSDGDWWKILSSLFRIEVSIPALRASLELKGMAFLQL